MRRHHSKKLNIAVRQSAAGQAQAAAARQASHSPPPADSSLSDNMEDSSLRAAISLVANTVNVSRLINRTMYLLASVILKVWLIFCARVSRRTKSVRQIPSTSPFASTRPRKEMTRVRAAGLVRPTRSFQLAQALWISVKARQNPPWAGSLTNSPRTVRV